MPSHLDFWARAPQRRCPPFLRLPTTSRLLAWLLASTLTATALAQPAHTSDEATTPAPLHHPTLPLQSPQAPAEVDWAAANRAVAEFLRGHADIVNWEAHNAAATVAPPTPSPLIVKTDGAPHPGMHHDMHPQMHDKGPNPRPPAHHTDHQPAPQGGRP